MRFACLLTFVVVAANVCAQSTADWPWQHLQMPTAAQVQAAWQSPPPKYGPEPYYGLNGPVTLDVVRRDLDTMKALGYGAVTVQYGAGAPFGYLTPEYFAFFRQFVQEAKRRNLRIWIVDDAGYPSGFAGGKFTQEHPELGMQALVVDRKLSVHGGDKLDELVAANVVAATAMKPGAEAVSLPVVNGHVRWTVPAGEWTVTLVAHVFRTSPTRSDTNPKRVKDGSQTLEDYLDPAATAQYLRYTHDAYQAAVGAEFGRTILGFRGDEPDYSIAGLPWTPRFFDRFRALKGYDVQPYLAALLQGKDLPLTAVQLRAKADFYDVFATMFRDGFFKPQADWCAAHGLEYQVHLNHEEMELQLARSEGDFFRDMRYVQVPGIDAIWHQIWTDTVSDFPRLASSAAHVYGHPRAFTESFAAYRPAPDVTMARYILNEQFVRGVNLVETMYFPASSTQGRGLSGYMRDPAFPALMAYTRRMSYLMSMGRPGASVALLLPTASLWMNDARADDTFVATERMLSEQQIDFDIIDEDALGSLLEAGKGTLGTLSGNRYGTILIPNASVMTEAEMVRLRELVKGGGHALFVGGTPALISAGNFLSARAAVPADFAWATVSMAQLEAVPTPPAQPPAAPPAPQVVPAELLAALRKAVPSPELKLDRPDAALRYTHRVLDGASVFLLFNESAAVLRNGVTLTAGGSVVEAWDAQTGVVKPAVGARVEGGRVHVPVELPGYGVEVLVVR